MAGVEPWFQEVGAASGIDFVHDPGASPEYLFPEIMGSGVCLIDYDRDGALDLYFVQSGALLGDREAAPVNRLYRNLGGFRFTDVTERAGVGDPGLGMGCAVGDVDGDGWQDLYVTNVGPNVLYHNRGDGSFVGAGASLGVDHAGWGTSTLFFDFDLDGDLDLLVVNYVEWWPERELECYVGLLRDYCSPSNYNAPAMDLIYRNQGGRFEEVGQELGLGEAFGNGLGVAAADLLGGGRPEIFVANDDMANQLWVFRGGSLSDEALVLGAAFNRGGKAEAGMGVALADPDRDGDADLFLSHVSAETNTFYRNDGMIFDDATARLGLAAPSLGRTGFGAGFADFDHDGRLDLYVANGRVSRSSDRPREDDRYAEPNFLFRGLEGGRFEEVRPVGGTAEPLIATSRGAAFGDLDGDGAVDVVVSNRGERPHLLRNLHAGSGDWVMFRVWDGNRDALGARVRVDASGGSWWGWVGAASSYCSANDPRVHFGLGAAERVDRVVVTWPGGVEESFGAFPTGALHELRRGAGRPSPSRSPDH